MIKNYSELTEEKHTKEEWETMLNEMRKGIIKVPEWVYYHFLEAVPPIYPKNGIGFFCGEPLTTNKENNFVYRYFFKLKGVYYGTISSIKTQKFSHELAKKQLNEVL